MKIVQSIVDGAFRLAIARSRRGGRRFAFNRAFSTSKIDVSKSIKSTRRDRIRPITRNPIRSNPPLDRADLRRREIRPIDRPSPRLRPTAARVRSREPSLDVARVATFAARRVAIRRARARECGRARRPRRRARRRARASVRVKFSRAVSRARERDGASASASRASISRARRRAAPP